MVKMPVAGNMPYFCTNIGIAYFADVNGPFYIRQWLFQEKT
jgi:hypothetical protein